MKYHQGFDTPLCCIKLLLSRGIRVYDIHVCNVNCDKVFKLIYAAGIKGFVEKVKEFNNYRLMLKKNNGKQPDPTTSEELRTFSMNLWGEFKLPDHLQEICDQQYDRMFTVAPLYDLSKDAIRNVLVDRSGTNLFLAVPTLNLPSLMKENLLHGLDLSPHLIHVIRRKTVINNV